MNQAKLNWFFFLPESASTKDSIEGDANYIYGTEALPSEAASITFFALLEWYGKEAFVPTHQPICNMSKIVWRQTLAEAKLDAGDRLQK